MSKMKQAAVSLLLVLSLLAALMAPAGAAFWQKPDPLQFNDDGSFYDPANFRHTGYAISHPQCVDTDRKGDG